MKKFKAWMNEPFSVSWADGLIFAAFVLASFIVASW